MKSGEIVSNDNLQGDYYIVQFYVPEAAAKARAGQFVHVRIDDRLDHILRRPFSIHDVSADGRLSVVYKVVGAGTRNLSLLKPGAVCEVLGPLGKGFSDPAHDEIPVIVAGGYGAAATYLLTRQSPARGLFLIGARSRGDVILIDRYQAQNYQVLIATNDGSLGAQGFVTKLVQEVIQKYAGQKIKFYGCGPHPMLMALAKILQAHHLPGELSIDHLMCCGVGSCFGCVVKTKADTPEGWKYSRACADGPVFDLNEVFVE